MLPRYFTYATFEATFHARVASLKNVPVQLDVIGKSVLGASIYGLVLGAGEHRILAWSNMHGNESTTTRSLIAFLGTPELADLLAHIRLYIIPVLNPDGLDAWTRVNAQQVDLNRDAQLLSQPESVVLRKVFHEFNPHFCFNMHDQRSIYGTINGDRAVQLSFLAPAADAERSITPARLAAMQVINKMVQRVGVETTGVVGRYDDAFNKHCVGDYFQQQAVPTILFEAGHAGLDYDRAKAVQLITKAFTEALKAITAGISCSAEATLAAYGQLPAIYPNFVDVLLKNVTTAHKVIDLAIHYHEMVDDGILYFVPILVGINDSTVKNAHLVIDCTGIAHDVNIDANLVVSSKSLSVLTFH